MKNKKYKNKYAFFIRRILKNRGLTIYGFSKNAKISDSTFYDIANGNTKFIKHKTMVQLIQDLGYYDLQYFTECFEQFEKYGIIVKPQIVEDYTPRAVATFCVSVLLAAGLYYILAR